MAWLFVFGEPNFNTYGTTWWHAIQSGLILWLKVVSLFCLLGWVVSWVSAALKERTVARGDWLDIAALAAIVGAVGTMLLSVLESTHRIAGLQDRPVIYVGDAPGRRSACAILFLWVESGLWATIRRSGRRGDLVVLVGIHLALAARARRRVRVPVGAMTSSPRRARSPRP